jgi:copper chaperone NosL
MNRASIILTAFLALAACREDESATRPTPVTMTEEALGHYCQMNLTEHPGPKAQVHLAGMPAPLFFSQVRDAIAYQRMPEQSHAITAIYVNDMAVAPSWEAPGIDNWLLAADAVFVVGSDAEGGMAAPELVPFGDRAAAEAFAAERGGTILTLAEIPDTEVLTPVSLEGDIGADDDDDFLDRLGTLSETRQN